MMEYCQICEERGMEVRSFPMCNDPAAGGKLCESCAESEGFEWDGNY